MTELPELLKSGELARLIPVIADSRREQRVVSVLLSTLTAVPEFAQTLLQSVDQKVGTRTIINTFTEVVFANQTDNKDRPDGYIHLQAGKREWSALLEAKIGNASLGPEQVEKYVQIARENDLDAVITISNQFAAKPEHHPVSISKTLTRKVDLFHWSWTYILTEAMLLQRQAAVSDPDRAFILREFIRFLSHESIGIKGFDRMPAEWRGVLTDVQSGATIKRSSLEVESVVSAWHQETRDLELQLSHHLAVNVSTKLTRAEAANPENRLRESCGKLADNYVLEAEFVVPNAASPIAICADLKTRTIKIGMGVEAPQDKSRGKARLNWLLRQLSHNDMENLYVKLIWPTRAKDTICSLHEIREDSTAALEEGHGQPPRAFEVFHVTDDVRRFSGRKRFIEDLESVLPTFYDQVGQHLQTWRPKPPKPAEDVAQGRSEKTTIKVAKEAPAETKLQPKIEPGNRHSFLLEIPSFLKRS